MTQRIIDAFNAFRGLSTETQVAIGTAATAVTGAGVYTATRGPSPSAAATLSGATPSVAPTVSVLLPATRSDLDIEGQNVVFCKTQLDLIKADQELLQRQMDNLRHERDLREKAFDVHKRNMESILYSGGKSSKPVVLLRDEYKSGMNTHRQIEHLAKVVHQLKTERVSSNEALQKLQKNEMNILEYATKLSNAASTAGIELKSSQASALKAVSDFKAYVKLHDDHSPMCAVQKQFLAAHKTTAGFAQVLVQALEDQHSRDPMSTQLVKFIADFKLANSKLNQAKDDIDLVFADCKKNGRILSRL